MATFHGAENAINVSSLLTNNIASGTATPTIGVSTGDGALFALIPTPFYVTLALAAETETGATDVVEVFNVTNVAGDNLTTDARGISNTTALDWSIGDKVQVRVVDLQFNEIHDAINDIESGGILTNASLDAAAAIATSKLADGATFIRSGGSVAMAANLDMDSNEVVNVADPTLAQSAMTLAYADATYLKIDGSVALTGDLDADSNLVINVANAVSDTDAMNKQSVYGVTNPMSYKNAADWTTTGNINLTGLGTQANGEWTGALAGTERILAKDQTSPDQNGLYTPAAGAWSRTSDAGTDANVANGVLVFVRQGAIHGGTYWGLTTAPPITLGVTNLTFEQEGNAATISIGSTVTGGTDGSVLFVASGQLAENNSRFFWDDTNYNLLISGATGTLFTGELSTAVTNAVSVAANFTHATSGTPAVGFGAGIQIGLHDDNNVPVANAGMVSVKWTDPAGGSLDSAIAFNTLLSSVDGARALIEANGSVAMQTEGATLKIKEGANACMGTATLAAGTVTVNTTAVTANSRIFLTRQEGGTPADFGHLQIGARVAGTSFDIDSTDVADDSVVAWMIVEPS